MSLLTLVIIRVHVELTDGWGRGQNGALRSSVFNTVPIAGIEAHPGLRRVRDSDCRGRFSHRRRLTFAS